MGKNKLKKFAKVKEMNHVIEPPFKEILNQDFRLKGKWSEEFGNNNPIVLELACGKGEFINGARLVYPMEKEAMRFLNTLGNKFFSLAFSWLLEQPIKDSLCGTKVMFREDYVKLIGNRKFFGEFDPFGDFDLLFGAYKLNLKIIDLPIRYQERVYGDTNISRFKHGVILLRMCMYAAGKIKFW